MDKATLLALVDSYITTNGHQEITGAQLNELLHYIVQSYPNKEDDNSLLGTSDYNPTRTYIAGMTAVVGKSIKRATQTTTGTYKPEDWENLVDDNTSLTYSELQALVSGATLVPEQKYFDTTNNIYLTAKSTTKFYSQAILKARNADHDNVTGNFIGVWTGTTRILYNTLAGGDFTTGNLIVGGTSGAIGEIILNTDANILGQRLVQVISKNGIAFTVAEVLTETDPASTPTGVTANAVTVTTTAILGTIAINKIVAWDNLHYVNTTGSGTIKHPKYDTANWTVLATTDVSYQTDYDPVLYNFATNKITSRIDKFANVVIDLDGGSCLRFQWGRQACNGNKVFSFSFDNRNAAVGQNNMLVQDSGCYIADSANASYAVIKGRSTCIYIGTADALASKVFHGNVTMTAGYARHTGFNNLSDISIYDTTNDVSDSEFRCCKLVLTGTSKLFNCVIDGGYNKLQKLFNNESHTDKVYKAGVMSTFEVSMTIANTDTSLSLDLTGFYAIYNITTTGGVASIDSFTIANRIRINPVGSNNIIFVHGSGLKLKGAVNKTIKAAEDWIEFFYNNSLTCEYASGQYTAVATTYEDQYNKATDFTTVNDTLYPSVKAVNDKINSAIEGLKPKTDVVVATTANITLSGAQTIDGVAVIAGDRVLVKDQSTAADNGIYVVASGAWTRASDANTATEVQGAVVSTQSGTANGDTTWRQTADAITLGSTALVWSQFGASVPDATPSTKGKARLYTSVAGTNTDGAPDQNSVKAALDLKADLTMLDEQDLHLVVTFRTLTNN